MPFKLCPKTDRQFKLVVWLPGAIFGGTSKNTLVRIKIGVFLKNELIPGQIG